jgi:RES domain-containing protein
VILWRISNYSDLLGIGGVQTAGRWHNRGIPIVYLAESPALAMLEVLVHFELSTAEIPERFQLLEVEYPQRKAIARLPEKALDESWRDDLDYTRSVGDEWLAAANSVLLKVPSAVVPRSFNYLFNPRHAEAKAARILSVAEPPYDRRLL